MADAQEAAVLPGIAIVGHAPDDVLLNEPSVTKFRRPVLRSEIRKRNPHALNPECENMLRRQCYREFARVCSGNSWGPALVRNAPLRSELRRLPTTTPPRLKFCCKPWRLVERLRLASARTTLRRHQWAATGRRSGSVWTGAAAVVQGVLA